MHFYMVTLGCPKNRVDSEVGWASMAGQGWICVDRPEDADVIIVNTCAFVKDAVSESLDTIVELGRYRIDGRCSLFVVTGCLPARYGQDLIPELEEVDLFLGSEELSGLGNRLQKLFKSPSLKGGYIGSMRRGLLPRSDTPRLNSLSAGAAYLKVAEGCYRKCSFCLIPKLRGPQRSSPLEDLVKQAESLVEVGAEEIVLVAQDLAGWGNDLEGKPEIADLVEALSCVSGLSWIRLMYFFPNQISDRLLHLFSDRSNVLPYLDMPFQHVDDAILSNMRRGGDAKSSTELVQKLRGEIPAMVLRSTLMTGFPGETDAAFGRLLDWVVACRFERLGVFVFSPEEGTDASGLTNQVPTPLAERRRDELMTAQAEIAKNYHLSLIGTLQDVLVEKEISENRYLGRTWNQAPEVDGYTIVVGNCKPGRIVKARITDADSYDLTAQMVCE